MSPCPDMGQSLAFSSMKQLLLICAVVALVGCKEVAVDVVGEVILSEKRKKEKARRHRITVEIAIRDALEKHEGELTKADHEKVTGLNLSYNKLTEVPKDLEKLTKLKKLILSGNQLNSVKGLEKLDQLKELILSHSKLNDLPAGLEKLNQLTYLELVNNPDLTQAQIDELQKALPNCRITSFQ